MDRIYIDTWANISADGWSSLLLGNGASIAIHKEFAYPTLHGIADAKGLLATTAPIFAKLGTTDFEHVLLACWYAEHVNVALGTPSTDISAAYAEVRTALIEAVHSVHPIHADVAAELQRVGTFASAFPTVVSLNYDLTLYWAMLLFNAANGSWFKDAFHHGEFQTDWEYLRRPYGHAAGATLVFYPHGSLSVARDYIGDETKIAASTGATGELLEAITRKWSSGHYVPVFVSEGTSKEKVAAIRRSHYLTNVYEEVLPAIGESLVVYGWSFDERDQHVLNAISANPPKRMAVSVFTGQPDGDQQAFCHQVLKAAGRSLPDTEVKFFDSRSPGCWNNCERAKDDVPPGLFGARNRQKKMTPYPQKTSPVRNRRQLTSLVSEVASRWTDEQLAPRPLSAVRGSISVPPRGPLVPFESSIERDFLMFCRTSHRVTAVHAQRLVIDFQDVKRGAARRYTPDFVVEVAADAGLSWRRAVVEVKTHRDLWRSRRLMRAPYAAARTWAAGQEGTIFRVVTDRMMSGEWLSSTRLLSGHLDKPFDVQFEQDCVAFLQQRDSYRISEILALAQQRGLNPQALLPVLYRMVARGQLSLDRGQPIGPQTWVAVVGSQKRL